MSKNQGFNNSPRLAKSATKPTEPAPSVLSSSVLSKLSKLSARVKKPIVATVTAVTSAYNADVVPVMENAGVQLAEILSAENFDDLVNEKNEIVKDVCEIVNDAPTHVRERLILACLTTAWSGCPKDFNSLKHLTSFAMTLGLFYENSNSHHYLPFLKQDGRTVTSTFATSEEALGLLKKMATCQNIQHTAHKDGVKDAVAEFKKKATTRGILDAVQKGGGIAWFGHSYNDRPGTALVEVRNVITEPVTGEDGKPVMKPVLDQNGKSVRGEDGKQAMEPVRKVTNCDFLPLEGIGTARKPIEGAMELSFVMRLSMLSTERLQTPERIEQEEFRKALTWWYMLKDAMKGAKQNQAIHEKAEAFKAQATLSAEEWYTTEKKGTFALYNPRWLFKKGRGSEAKVFHHVLWLLERDKDGNICVVDAHNKDSQELLAVDVGLLKLTPADEVLDPLKNLLLAGQRYYEGSLKKKASPPVDEGAELAKVTKTKEEREAKRDKVAKAEAERLGLDNETDQS